MRVPGWCESFSVNGKPFEGETVKGYAFLTAQNGESITLDFAMECRLAAANPAVEADIGRVALCRGPIVYCAERVDNGVPLNNLSVSARLNPSLEFDEKMQAYKIEADGFEDGSFGELYRTYRPDFKPRRIKFIPYFAFANRGESDMLVWIRIRE